MLRTTGLPPFETLGARQVWPAEAAHRSVGYMIFADFSALLILPLGFLTSLDPLAGGGGCER